MLSSRVRGRGKRWDTARGEADFEVLTATTALAAATTGAATAEATDLAAATTGVSSSELLSSSELSSSLEELSTGGGVG